jgi:branched-chain amino acid transport system permease protein
MASEDFYWALIDLVNGLVSGTLLGGYYAIIAIGLSLTFGVMRLVNLAHGDWLVVGAYLAVIFVGLVSASPFFALIVVAPIMFAVGYLIQSVLLNRVSVQAMEQKGMSTNFGLMAPILVTFGMSIVLSQAMMVGFSSDTRIIPNALSFSAINLSGDLNISTLRLIFFAVAVGILVVVQVLLRGTFIGRAIRAASDDAEIAPLMGMHTSRIYAFASGISLAIAGVAGVMIGMLRPFQPFDGPQFLLIAFGVVILGGLGSLTGTLVGGIILGIVQVLAGTYFGPSAQLVAGYMLILLVLAFRPQGIFSR